MRRPKSNYELRSSQVATPNPVVNFFWQVVQQHRQRVPRVLDLGAGDGRFSVGANFDHYLGVEIDPTVARLAKIPPNGEIRIGCAFSLDEDGFDACIGNPPYVRHHDIASPWKERTIQALSNALDTSLDAHGNLYLYFIALALIKTNSRGLVALLIPYEWTSRPSAKGIRQVLEREAWNVSVYRFSQAVFPGVLTTASITVIDKAIKASRWSFFDVSPNFGVTQKDNRAGLIAYSKRGTIYGYRGLSPGSQKVFTITEAERVKQGLSRNDVVPCVTSLRSVPARVRNLTPSVFRKYFIESGKRCWLIKSNGDVISKRLRSYLRRVPRKLRNTWTCKQQAPWYKYERAKVPELLLHSGFTTKGPKVLVNHVGAVNVGVVYGVQVPPHVSRERLQRFLTSCDVESRIVPHAKTLRKLEVGQVNTLLEEWWRATRSK